MAAFRSPFQPGTGFRPLWLVIAVLGLGILVRELWAWSQGTPPQVGKLLNGAGLVAIGLGNGMGGQDRRSVTLRAIGVALVLGALALNLSGGD